MPELGRPVYPVSFESQRPALERDAGFFFPAAPYRLSSPAEPFTQSALPRLGGRAERLWGWNFSPFMVE